MLAFDPHLPPFDHSAVASVSVAAHQQLSSCSICPDKGRCRSHVAAQQRRTLIRSMAATSHNIQYGRRVDRSHHSRLRSRAGRLIPYRSKVIFIDRSDVCLHLPSVKSSRYRAVPASCDPLFWAWGEGERIDDPPGSICLCHMFVHGCR